MLSGQAHDAHPSRVLPVPLASGKCSLAQTSGTDSEGSESWITPFAVSSGNYWKRIKRLQESDLIFSHPAQGSTHGRRVCIRFRVDCVMKCMSDIWCLLDSRAVLDMKAEGDRLRCLSEVRVPCMNQNTFHDNRNGIQPHCEAIISEVPSLVMLKKPSHCLHYIWDACHERCLYNASSLGVWEGTHRVQNQISATPSLSRSIRTRGTQRRM